MDSYEEIYKKVCRVCLTISDSEMVPIFDGNSSLTGYGIALETLADLNLSQDDAPNHLCKKCVIELKQAICFRKKCKLAQDYYNEISKNKTKTDFKEFIVDSFLFNKYFLAKDTGQRVSNIQPESPETNDDHFDNYENTFQDGADKNEYSKLLETLTKYVNKDSEKNMYKKRKRKLKKQIEKMRIKIGMGAGEKSAAKLKIKMEDKTSDDETLSNLNQDALKRYHYVKKNMKKGHKKSKTLRMLRQTIYEQYKAKNARRGVKQRGTLKRDKDAVPKVYSCDLCKKEFKTKLLLTRHIARHDPPRFVCEHCGRAFNSKAELKVHLVITHDTGDPYPCAECGYKAPRLFDLKEHQRLHTGERPFTCDKCGLTFRRKNQWRQHQVYHQDKSVQCEQCPQKFYTRGALHCHENSAHGRRFLYACPRCDQTYAKNTTVRKHLVLKHGVAREKQGKIKRILITSDLPPILPLRRAIIPPSDYVPEYPILR